MDRRGFLTLGGGALALACASRAALADVPSLEAARVPVPFDPGVYPPTGSKQAFIDWMVKNRGEDPLSSASGYDRFLQLIAHHDVWNDRNKRAYLMTPREDFVTKAQPLARL